MLLNAFEMSACRARLEGCASRKALAAWITVSAPPGTATPYCSGRKKSRAASPIADKAALAASLVKYSPIAIGLAPPPGLAKAMRRDAVRRFATESGKFPPRTVLIKACRWVRTSALVIAASRRCSNVIPDGPAPTPFSHLPNILAKSARGIESVDPCGVGHVTSSCSAELVAAWSASVAKPPSVPERATMATKPPIPSALQPGIVGAEKTPPHAPAEPLAASEAGPSAPAAVPSAPPAAPGPPAPLDEPSASAPDGGVADPPAPVLGVPVAPTASVPCLPAPASASSPKVASATTGEPAPMVAPSAAGQSAPAMTPVTPVGQLSRPPSPDHRSSRPHSPAPHQERKSSRHRRESPQRYQQQSHWPAHPGGQGDWRGPRARGGGGGYRPPVTMADLQREVSRAVREERAAQSQSSSLRASPAHEAPRPAALPPNLQPVAAPPPQILAPPAPSPAVSAPAPGSRLHLPPVPLVAGVEFVAAGGGAMAAPFALPVDADEALQFLAEALQPPQTRVPEATLGQLHRLAGSLHALLLIQVLAHSSLPVIPLETFRGRQRDSCLDAADRM
ncbi:unnamed protein product [Closterium sp. Naga37s-1]|nr:unnamed protein product [Closterium sp. Naga37s-1]